MEIECRKRVDEVRKEWEVKNGEMMGESLQTRMKDKTAEWAKQQLENQNVSLMNRFISEKEVTEAVMEEGEDSMEVKIAEEEVDCLFTLMIDCTCEKNDHLNIKVSDN